jgi:GT2 family glycosyltransferase
LDSVFAGSARPTATFVIDNGSFAGRLHGESIIEYSYGKNLGVAASWNRLFSIAEGFSLPVFILNDDIELGRNTLERMLASDADFVSVAGAGINAFSCFLLRRAAYDLVGPFDETFYPAYVEDSDYSYRMMLADVRCEAVECDGFTHHGSATKMG